MKQKLIILSLLVFSCVNTQALNVYFDRGGGPTPNPWYKVVSFNQSYGTLATTTRDGYTFGGWWTEVGGTGSQIYSYSIVSISTDHRLYPKWTALRYLVTFNSQGGSTPSPTTKYVYFDSTYGNLATTSRTDYNFDGWWTGLNGTGTNVTATTVLQIASGHTLYAKWLPKNFNIIFDSQGGITANPTSKNVTHGSVYDTLATTTRTGYTFGGWWTGPNGTGSQITSSTTVTIKVEHTLYAQWLPNDYTVLFDPQGGTTAAPMSVIVTYGEPYGLLAATTRTGYTFDGWWTGSHSSGMQIFSATVLNIASNHSLYAAWSTDAYTVINGQNVIPVIGTNAINSAVEHSGDNGFSLKLGGLGLLADGGVAGVEWSVTGAGILTFDWQVSSEADYDWLRFYEVGTASTNFISGTGSGWTQFTVTVTNSPHTFRWEYEKDPAGDFVGNDCGWVDAIRWSPFFSVIVNGGAGDGQFTNGTSVTITAETPAPYFQFDRWIGETNGVANIFDSSTTLVMPANSVVVTASYKPILYSLSVIHGSGSGSYSYATTVELGAVPFEGKRFYSWTGDVDTVSEVASATTTVVTAAQTLSIAATYSVPLTVNEGSGSGWYPEGSMATVIAGPATLYKEFAAWTGDATGFLANAYLPTTSLTMPTHPASLTATYRDSISRVTGSYGRTYTTSGTSGGLSADTAAGSPSGTPAVKLGGTGLVPDNGFVAFETIVSGSGTVTFWWKVSSESNADYLKFIVDGAQIAAVSGTKGTWAQVTNRVEGAGVTHTLRWEYAKNASVAGSTDAGWVDDIVWTGDVPEPVIRPDISAVAATDGLFGISFLGERGIPYTVYSNATLEASGWAPMAVVPLNMGETNGVFRFLATAAPDRGQKACFYRMGIAPEVPATPSEMVLVQDGSLTNIGSFMSR